MLVDKCLCAEEVIVAVKRVILWEYSDDNRGYQYFRSAGSSKAWQEIHDIVNSS